MDLAEHLKRQIAFSRATFGPGPRTHGVIDHIKKELAEIVAAKNQYYKAKEWVDVVILGLDGLTRALVADGYNHDTAAFLAERMLLEKQGTNETREWPDWRTADPDKAIEHKR